MRFIQYYLDCLSQASYLIGDETTGRAAVVDPRRDIGEYLDDAAAAGLRVEYVIETHVHADFLSGHLELAAVTGAAVVYGRALTSISRTVRSPTVSAWVSAGSSWRSGPPRATRRSRSAS